MEEYKDYLQNQNYTETTIENYISQAQSFIKWCKRNHTSPEAIEYTECLKYIKYLQRKGTTKKTVNHRLGRVKVYMKYLVEECHRTENPIENTTIKGIKREINYHLLDADELEDLYYSYTSDNVADKYHKLCAKRNRVIVGLMVYQGLNTTNLKALELEHIEIYKGKVHVPGHKKMNERTLELKPWQVIELLEYINEVREEIVFRKNVESSKLFVPNNQRLDNTIINIIKKLKKTNTQVKNIHQIRASVIANWLGQLNIRKVQYLAGHRYISSTEKYLQDDLENLQEIINESHPIS